MMTQRGIANFPRLESAYRPRGTSDPVLGGGFTFRKMEVRSHEQKSKRVRPTVAQEDGAFYAAHGSALRR